MSERPETQDPTFPRDTETEFAQGADTLGAREERLAVALYALVSAIHLYRGHGGSQKVDDAMTRAAELVGYPWRGSLDALPRHDPYRPDQEPE